MEQRFRRALWTLTALTAAVAALAPAAAAAPPTSSTPPTIEGNADIPFVGDTLRASRGTWAGSPTSYAYQWDRCNPLGDRQGCAPIAGATTASYTVQKADVGHTLRVRVTARNADGSATRDARPTGIVSDTTAPKNYVKPDVTGSASVGSTLTATPGTWAGATSAAYQWQQCEGTGTVCTDIAGATGKTYGVRATDVGRTLRVEVTGPNKYGSTKAQSDRSAPVTAGTPSTTTTVVTTTVAGNRAPSIAFLSLKVRSNRVYARFRVCDDSGGRITVIERDQKARRLAYTRKFAVSPTTCAVYSRSWQLIQRFRGSGRFVVSLRAQDASKRLSRQVSRAVVLR
jgi:hypothetical protein